MTKSGGGLEYLHCSPAELSKAMKSEPGACGYNWVNEGHKYSDVVLQVEGWTQGRIPCSVKNKIVVWKSKKVEIR